MGVKHNVIDSNKSESVTSESPSETSASASTKPTLSSESSSAPLLVAPSSSPIQEIQPTLVAISSQGSSQVKPKTNIKQLIYSIFRSRVHTINTPKSHQDLVLGKRKLLMKRIEIMIEEAERLPPINIGSFIFIILALTTIIIALVHINDCPKRQWLPTFVIIHFGLSLISVVINYCLHLANRDKPPSEVNYPALVFCFDFFLSIYTIMSFIIICIGVFSAIWPDNNPDSPEYCNQLFYTLIFVQMAVYISLILLLICCCCCTCVLFNLYLASGSALQV